MQQIKSHLPATVKMVGSPSDSYVEILAPEGDGLGGGALGGVKSRGWSLHERK